MSDRQQVSVGGGIRPEWSAAGDAVLYLRTGADEPPDAVMRVAIETREGEAAAIEVGAPEFSSAYTYAHHGFGFRHHDVATDGRLLVVRYETATDEPEVQSEIVIVQNWLDELKRVVPVD